MADCSLVMPASRCVGALPFSPQPEVMRADALQGVVVDVHAEVGQGDQAQCSVAPQLERGGCRG